MHPIKILQVGTDFKYKWGSGEEELYPLWVEYQALANARQHRVRIGFGTRPVYDQERIRVVVWIDGQPQVEFLGADDYGISGEVLSEIRLHDEVGERMCRYPDEVVPPRCSHFTTVGLPTRVSGKGVHNAWTVVANVSDHFTMIRLGVLRREERGH
jgi:hypothetical protein